MNIFSTLRSRLIMLVVIVAFPLVAFSFLNALDEEKVAVEGARNSLQWAVSLAAANQDQKMESIQQVMVTLAETPDLLVLSPSACNDYLARLNKRFPEYSDFGLVALNGQLRCHSSGSPAGIDVSDRSYFKRAMATGQFAIGNYQRSRITGTEVLVSALPIQGADGAIKGVATATIGLDALFQSLSVAKLPATARLSVLDSQGTVLVSTDPFLKRGDPTPDALVLKKVGELAAGLAQEPGVADEGIRLFAFPERKGAARLGLFTVASMNTLAITQPAREKLLRDLVILGAIVMLAGILAIGMANRAVGRPTAEILQSVSKIGANDLQARVRLEPRGVAWPTRCTASPGVSTRWRKTSSSASKCSSACTARFWASPKPARPTPATRF